MPIDPKAGLRILREVVSELDSSGMNYWLGRGVFRNWTINQEFGYKQGDIDFHILREEVAKLRGMLDRLNKKGYRVISTPEQTHKITILKENVQVEFVFLERDGNLLWHQAGFPGKKRYDCPGTAFGDRRVNIFGVSVRGPDEEYLPAVFGPDWRRNEKGSGGRPIS